MQPAPADSAQLDAVEAELAVDAKLGVEPGRGLVADATDAGGAAFASSHQRLP
jgi:hypothetical protein